jgi:predicted tellurium resistance membrane protein TerC
VPDDRGDDVTAGTSLWQAIRIVVIADIIMSLDNVIAVAAAANGQLPLLILGLAISIPMIIAGAAVIMMVLDRLPILVWLGAILLGWIAGGVIATDPAVHPFLQRLLDSPIAVQLDATLTNFGAMPHVMRNEDVAEYACSVLGAIAVLAAGSIWRKRRLRHTRRPARPEATEAAQPVERR